MSIDQHTCRSALRRASALAVSLGAFTLALGGGCLLTGIEPDEIDVADDGTGADELGEGETGEGADTGDGDGDTGHSGDGDGDPTTGDGDGDGGDGDGDGDGDPDPAMPCSELGPNPLVDGPNPIEVAVGPNSFAGSCGGLAGPDALFSYTATSEGLVSFALSDASFDAVVYLVGELCEPLDEWVCDAGLVETLMTVDQTVYIIVDSQQADVGGTATLTITGP